MRLPEGWGEMSGKIEVLNRSFYGVKQASRLWHNHLVTRKKSLGFEQGTVDAFVMRLVESRSVYTIATAHVKDIIAVGVMSRCRQFCEDLNCLFGSTTWASFGGMLVAILRGIGMLVLRRFRNKLSLKHRSEVECWFWEEYPAFNCFEGREIGRKQTRV